MKFLCSFSVNFNGKKSTGRPKNTFARALKEFEQSNFADGAIEISVDSKRDDFLLELCGDNNKKFLEAKNPKNLKITQNGMNVDLLIPKELVSGGSCQNVCDGFQAGTKVEIHLSFHNNPAAIKKFESFLKKLEAFQSKLEQKPKNPKEKKTPAFCPCFTCHCEFCLSKKQKEKASLQKEAKLKWEKAQEELIKERELLEEQLRREQKANETLHQDKNDVDRENKEMQKVIQELRAENHQLRSEKSASSNEKSTFEAQLYQEQQKLKSLQIERDDFKRKFDEDEKISQKLRNDLESLKEEKRRLEDQIQMQKAAFKHENITPTKPQQTGTYYVTQTGKCYHMGKWCRYLSENMATRGYEARDYKPSGLRACSRCC